MESNFKTLSNIPNQPFDLNETSCKMHLSEVFAERKGMYLNEFTLFIAHFNAIPNFIHQININCDRANKWFAEKYKAEIKDWYYSKVHIEGNKTAVLDDIFYFLYEDLIVDFDTNSSIVRFLFKKTDITKVEVIIKEIKKFKNRKPKGKPELLLLIALNKGFSTKTFRLLKPKLNIADNYNDDFEEIHQTILKRLSKNNDKGLVLLHGKPGTGKTSYIRYLVSSIKKKVIFLPPNMACVITNPDLISVLVDNPNSIFVIEDAENIIADREKNGYSPVSALLNVSDGLLSDCLNIQIICSFNTDISKVDSALMRKGRLIAKYEFKELEMHKVNALSKKLGYATNFTSPATLTAIYNQEEKDFQQCKTGKTIGFMAGQINN